MAPILRDSKIWYYVTRQSMMTNADEYASPRFRITAWPERIPLPPVLAGSYTLDESRSALLINFPERPYWSHGETYLTLYALDLDDPEQILAFANEYAHLDGAEMRLAYDDEHLIVRAESDEAALRMQRDAVRETGERIDFYPEFLEDFRFAATALRDLTSAWRLVSGQAEAAEIKWAWFHGRQPALEDAASLLAAHLSGLLRRLHPQLHLNESEADESGVAITVGTESPHAVSLFELCAAELYNHVVARPSYKRCANESCKRLFVLQSGRAEHGQHRTSGVKYCSASCARAQNQRRYRRRHRHIGA
jgi:hypothetical protein